MQYYVIINNQQSGPYDASLLSSLHLTPSSMVWREGMTDWQPASQLPELSYLFSSMPPAYNVAPQTPPQAPKVQPTAGYGNSAKPYFSSKVGAGIGAFVLALFCGGLLALIPAIVGWVKASNAQSLYMSGDYDQAMEKNNEAQGWITAAYVICAIVFVIFVILIASA